MTLEQPLYWSSPYQRELIATIIDIKDDAVLLNHTIFYPGGGGQPCDTGILVYEDHKLEIMEVFKDGDTIWHKIKIPKDLTLEVNKEVILRLDWKRRYMLMKAHTAQHLVSHFIKKDYGYDTLKANFWPGEIEIEIDGELTEEQLLSVLSKANEKIMEGVEVKSIVVDQETFQKEYKDKIRGKISTEPVVRMIQLGDFDIVCCGGIHVRKLSEIKGIFLETIKKSTIKFLVDEKGINFSNKQRTLMYKLERLTEKKGDKLVKFTENKITQAEELSEVAIQLLRLIFRNTNSFTEKLGNYSIAIFDFPKLERALIQNALKELKAEVLIIIHGKGNIVYFISNIKALPANDIAKAFIEETNGRGGGNEKFAQVAIKPLEEPITLIRRVIEKIIEGSG